MQTIEVRRGATLSLAGLVALPAGTWSVTSELRDSGSRALGASLAASLIAPAPPATKHQLLLSLTAAQTEGLACKVWLCDIRFTDASPTPVVLQSPTFALNLVDVVTTGAPT